MSSQADRRRTAVVALAAYTAFLAFVLLNPSADVPTNSVSWLTRVASGLGLPELLQEPGRIEFVANVLILVPLAFLGSIVLPGLDWRDWTAYGFVLSGCVELAQGLFLPARSATFADVVANTLGTLLGAFAFALVARLQRRRQAARTG